MNRGLSLCCDASSFLNPLPSSFPTITREITIVVTSLTITKYQVRNNRFKQNNRFKTLIAMPNTC